MKLQDRSYSSKVFRPKPQVHLEADGSLLIVSTSWGLSDHANLVNDEVAKYVTAARGDVEVTSPFEFLTCLSDQANHLRIGLMIANDVLYRGANKNEYVSGVEVLALSKTDRQIAWAQVGSPHLLLRREGRPLVPLVTSFDHSFELGLRGETPAPLPSRLLGVEPVSQIVCGDLQANPNDLLILLASSHLPPALWNLQGPLDLQELTKHLVKEDPTSPFWMAMLDFTS